MGRYGFFNSVEGDRTYNANDLNMIYSGVRTDGVVEGMGAELEPMAYGNARAVSIQTGQAIVKNKWFEAEDDTAIISVGDSLPRIDALVLRVNETSRSIDLVVIEGTPASSPTAPAIDSLTDLLIAHVSVAANERGPVSDSQITDERSYTRLTSMQNLLWENANPSASFSEQEITLTDSVDNYELISVEFKDGSIALGKTGQWHSANASINASTNSGIFRTQTRGYESSGTKMLFSNVNEMQLTGKLTEQGNITMTMTVPGTLDSVPIAVYGINKK